MLLNRFPFGLQVDWVDTERFSPVQPELQDWLLNTGSLTERLEGHCERFSVQVLGQASVALDNSEKRLLYTQSDQDWQVREVILHGDDQPWVFARSVLPLALCEAELKNLGSKPLGKRIFNDPEFVRSEFEVGRMLVHPLTNQSKTGHALYARRSCFTMQGQQLLVAEAFLPDCPCYQNIA
ncbi:chorismate--pyruvate lyase family protein [Glaciecola sp. 1036]|uniref:chorismate--pyruvate lyase family protein n=1 Tax=Alteromonadaceae TaxID=72275 RepID=UPI003CFBE15C